METKRLFLILALAAASLRLSAAPAAEVLPAAGSGLYCPVVCGTCPPTVADTGDVPQGFDYRVLKFLQQHRTPGWNSHWVWVSNTFVCSALPPLGLAIGGWTTPQSQPERRNQLLANSLEALSAFGLTAALTISTKYIVRRQRPFARYAGDLCCLQNVPDPSFPSGHTSFAFAAATSLTLIYPRWYVALPAYLWAGGVAFSRLYVGAHYPTDVLVGAAVGAGCALLVHAVRSRLATETPALAPARQAVVIPVTITF